MTRGRSRLASTAYVIASWACSDPYASTIEVRYYELSAVLSPASVVPAATAAAEGSARITVRAWIDKRTGRWDPELAPSANWAVEVAGLSGPATEIHLHRGHEGATGALLNVLPIGDAATSGVIASGEHASGFSTGEARNFDLLVDLAEARELYLDVHTAAHPGGELRGQVLPR